jgi:para-nitrobenzyl esterase
MTAGVGFQIMAPHVPAAGAGGTAYTYDFRWPAPAGPLQGLAFHCLDVPFVFGNLTESGVAAVAGPNPPRDLAADVHGAWVRFVADGDPGWPRYDAGARPVMLFGTPSQVAPDPLALERTAWSAALTQ